MMLGTWNHIKAKRAAIVVAHPDDEILSLGSQLSEFKNMLMVHVTDGVSSNYRPSRERRVKMRLSELDSALTAVGAVSFDRKFLHVVDQEVINSVSTLAYDLVPMLRGCEVVITHPYEGGHPDHDACSLLVYAACSLIEASNNKAPVRAEFASYHMRQSKLVAGEFWGPASSELVIRLDEAKQKIKRAALNFFSSAQPIISKFPISTERVRFAPRYEFSAPPPPIETQYDVCGKNWRIDGRRWRKYAKAMLHNLNLCEAVT